MAANRNGPKGNETESQAFEQLHNIRRSIDNIDSALIHLLAERFKATKLVGVLKAEHGLPPTDAARESQHIKSLRALARSSQLDPEFAEKWFNFIVVEVINHHVRAAEQRATSVHPWSCFGAPRRDNLHVGNCSTSEA